MSPELRPWPSLTQSSSPSCCFVEQRCPPSETARRARCVLRVDASKISRIRDTQVPVGPEGLLGRGSTALPSLQRQTQTRAMSSRRECDLIALPKNQNKVRKAIEAHVWCRCKMNASQCTTHGVGSRCCRGNSCRTPESGTQKVPGGPNGAYFQAAREQVEDVPLLAQLSTSSFLWTALY